MKKRTAIISIIVSLCLTVFAFIRLSYVKRIGSWEGKLWGTLIALSAVAMLYIAYKALLKRLAKGSLKKEDYALLFDLESREQNGEIEFYFTIEQPRKVVFSILDQKMESLKVLTAKDFPSGGHIIRFDAKELESGVYFYCLETDNQKTMKKMFVQHDNLTV